MKQIRRVLSMVLVLCMVLSLLPTVFAAGETSTEAGGKAAIGGLDDTWMTKYGNVNLDCQTSDFFQEMGFTWGDLVTVEFLSQKLELPVVPTYHYVDSGKPAIIAPKNEAGEPTGKLSMAINMGNFATTYGIAEKHTNEDKTYYWTAMEGVTFPVEVTFTMKEAGGYMAEYLLHDLNRTNNREDYANLTDEQFANFRNIATTGMGAGVLYRSSSPINPELGRNTYADKAAAAAGVKTFINLADDEAKAATYEGYAESYYSKQNIAFLNLGVDFSEASFQAGLAEGFRFMTTHEGPYLVHCTEGKDRAGYISALLECFMGATYEEVVADYMTTYINYYGVEKGSEKYDAIANSNIIKSLKTAFGVEDLTTADLKAGAEGYMKAIGLTDAELEALRANLSTAKTVQYELVANSGNMLKYGHLDMNVSTENFLKEFQYGDIVTVSFLDKSYDFPVCSNYDDVDTSKLLIRAATGKSVVTLARNYGQIGVEAGVIEANPEAGTVEGAPKYRVKEGVTFPITVTVTMKEAGGYADELSVRQLNRTDNREDYPELTDEQFANFRNITTTGMGKGILYRSSNPINPEIGRNTYADAAAAKAGIKTFVNLADSEAEAKARECYADSYYAKQNVVFLNLPVAFFSDEFKAGLAEGFRFIASHDGPYLVHCTEGKDRAGMTAAILECFMGASAEEVSTDYLTTFRNYYNVVDGKQTALTDAQEAYLRKAVLNNLSLMFGVEDAASADLAKEAAEYMKEIGLTDAEITALREKLSQNVAASVTTTAPATTEIDKYGDVRLSITSGELKAAGFDYADYVTVEFLGQSLKLPVIPEYRYVGAREAGLVMWKDETKPVELEVFNGSFAANYGLATKTTNADKTFFWTPNEGVTFPVTVKITMAEKGGYQDQYDIFDLVRTNAREDYADLTDEQFANFRAVSTTGMGKDILFRSSSPINPEIGRNTYADAAAKAHGIKTIMNLADSKDKAEAYAGFSDTYYSQQDVAFLGLGVDFLSDANRQGLAEGLRFFATHEGPYLVHCNEGQDRAGFTSALLECLMGASLEEVKADYATTFQNYYGVKVGTKQYETISGNIEKNLRLVFGVETLEGADLSKLAETYILGLGLTEAEVAALRENLGIKNPFTDVQEGLWYTDYILRAYEAGIVNGMTNTQFAPDANLTRGQWVTMLYRLAGAPETEAKTNFTDVPETTYYYTAIAWAAENGIVNGVTETTFEPESYITRQQLVTILARYAKVAEDEKNTEELSKFSDGNTIAVYAQNAVGWATLAGIVNGYTDGTFQPLGRATRAEAVKILSIFAGV